MSASKALRLLAFLVVIGTAAIALLNYRVDPLCYFNCSEITLKQSTVNSYYQNAQRVLQYPRARLIALGSSRGESLPLGFISDQSGLEALNLSVGGAEIYAKTAFLEFALKHLKPKKIIWLADYFELIDETASDKVRYTPPLQALVSERITGGAFGKLSLLLDHNTIGASFALLKKQRKPADPVDRGSSSDLNAERCAAKIATSRLTQGQLEKEIGIIFDGYAHKILQPPQSETAWRQLQVNIERTRAHGADFLLVIPSYHRDFMTRLKTEFPELAARHVTWLNRLKALESEGARVLDFFEKLPGDDGSPRYWSDGVHFTCHAAMEMLRDHLR